MLTPVQAIIDGDTKIFCGLNIHLIFVDGVSNLTEFVFPGDAESLSLSDDIWQH